MLCRGFIWNFNLFWDSRRNIFRNNFTCDMLEKYSWKVKAIRNVCILCLCMQQERTLHQWHNYKGNKATETKSLSKLVCLGWTGMLLKQQLFSFRPPCFSFQLLKVILDMVMHIHFVSVRVLCFRSLHLKFEMVVWNKNQPFTFNLWSFFKYVYKSHSFNPGISKFILDFV